MENIVDSVELMECIRGDSVIYLCSNKGFKIAWEKKKYAWKQMTSALEIDNQHKQGIILSELASWNRLEV